MHNRGSLFGPLLLILLGALLLARHALPAARIGVWIAHYWPVLLILWGVTRLIEHLSNSRAQRPQGLSGGEVVLLTLIICVGLAWSGVYRWRDSRMAQYWGIHVGDWNPFLQSYTFNAAAQGTAAAGHTVVVRGYRGNVHVTAGTGNGIAAAVTDTVKAESSDAARNIFDATQPVIQSEGDEIVVQPAGGMYHNNVQADLELTLPATSTLAVAIQNGDISLHDWKADLTLATTHGAVNVSNLTGSVVVTSGHDNVSLDHISGAATVRGSGDDITLADIGGQVLLQGEFLGNLSLSRLPHGLQFNSSRTSLRIAVLAGSVDYEMGTIKIADGNSITLHTRDEGVEINGFTGPLEVQDRNDDITATAAGALSGPIAITNNNSDIRLELPRQSQFNLTALARHGEIDSDFDIQKSENGNQAEARAMLGGPGAASITLNTNNGGITLSRSAISHD